MQDDILAQAEKICKFLSEVSQHWRNQSNAVLVVAGDQLPQLLAEAKNLKRTRDNYCQEIKNQMRWREEDNHFYDEIFGEIEKEIDAWQAKAIESLAHAIASDANLIWKTLPDDDRPDGLYPALTIRGRDYWRAEATKQLVEEMRND